jgi:uncharacterized membrane protein YdjX (TVP38/TMEM64 family)
MSSTHSQEKNAAAEKRRGKSWLKMTRRRWFTAGGLVAIAIAVTCLFAFTEFDVATMRDAVLRTIEGLNAVLLFVLMATLPVGGFSVALVYLVAGARFGPLVGGAMVAAATAVHLVLTHWISRSFLRGPIERFFRRRHHRIPEVPPGEEASVSVMAALIPGLPYFARNYLLALSGIPFRTYFWICLPIYVARSYLTIFLGDQGNDPSGRELTIILVVYALKLGICAYLLRRLQRRYKARRAASRTTTGHGKARHDTAARRRDLLEST